MQEQSHGRQILLVEDDASLAIEIAYALAAEGFIVHRSTLPDLTKNLNARPISTIIMDRMIFGKDSLEELSSIRSVAPQIPVIFISLLSSVDEKIRALRAGGDDYLIKPFAMSELLARVEVLMRRIDRECTTLKIGDVSLDLISRQVRRSDRAIKLLPREFQLLEYFMRRHDQIVTRAMLLEDIWHYKSTIQTNVIDAHIVNLRRKINGDGEPRLIKNIRGVGFCLSHDA